VTGYVPNPLGELHAELSGLRVLLDLGRHDDARQQLADLLNDWPRLVAELYGTPHPDADAYPLPVPFAATVARSGDVRVSVQVRIDRVPQGPDASG